MAGRKRRSLDSTKNRGGKKREGERRERERERRSSHKKAFGVQEKYSGSLAVKADEK